MLTLEELNKLYVEKLAATNSHDAAMLKVVWVAYCRGLADADKKVEPCEEPTL